MAESRREMMEDVVKVVLGSLALRGDEVVEVVVDEEGKCFV